MPVTSEARKQRFVSFRRKHLTTLFLWLQRAILVNTNMKSTFFAMALLSQEDCCWNVVFSEMKKVDVVIITSAEKTTTKD